MIFLSLSPAHAGSHKSQPTEVSSGKIPLFKDFIDQVVKEKISRDNHYQAIENLSNYIWVTTKYVTLKKILSIYKQIQNY